MCLKSFLFLIIGYILNQHCTAQVDSVKFGIGGGITGVSTIYKIYKHRLYKSDGKLIADFDSMAKLKCKDKKYIFDNANTTVRDIPEFNQPKNHYKFIEIYGRNSKNYVWGSGDSLSYPAIQQYYDSLIKIVNTYKYK